MSRIRRWAGLAIGLGISLSAAPVWAQTGGLTGHVTLPDGTSCVKCPIIIERQSIKGHYQTKTDKKGNYVYVGLPLDTYKITLQDPSGKTLFYITHHADLGDPTEVDFDLPKEYKAQQQAQAANPEVQKQQVEQQKEQKEMTSLKQIFDQGVALENQQQYSEAAAMFQKAEPLAKGANLQAVMDREAESLHKAKMNDQAVAVYQKLIAANPSEAEFHNNLGSVYADMGKTAEAQAEFEKAAELNPKGAARYYFNLGAIMSNTGKTDEAAAAFDKATKVDPTYAEAFYQEGRVLMAKATTGADGKIVPAPGTVEALKAYLQLQPNGPHAADVQALLQTIEGGVPTEYKAAKKKKS
jgi:tetratricopeptide (TPR) repeat protein